MSQGSRDHLFNDPFDQVSIERRRSHREHIVAIGKMTSLDASDSTRSIQILVTDVSLHGCDFRCAASPRDGAFYKLEVAVGPLALTSRMRIIRIQLRSDGTYEIGGEFV